MKQGMFRAGGSRACSCRFLLLLLLAAGSGHAAWAQDDFRVRPYLQNPAPDGMSILWFSSTDQPGNCTYRSLGTGLEGSVMSSPVQAHTLAYTGWEDSSYFGGAALPQPFRHRVRPEGLEAAATYAYTVIQGESQYTDTFRTAPVGQTPLGGESWGVEPGGGKAFRIIVFGDAETEPESTGKHAEWTDPLNGDTRSYLVDQTTGFRNNLAAIASRNPDLLFVAGDLVESGGEQRDWDEFWKHMELLAGKVPVLGALGNHEYYAGPYTGGYDQPFSEAAMDRYLTYFEYPSNGAANPRQEGRYYTLRYGPVSFIILDACNNGPNGSDEDTNFMLLGQQDAGGGDAPDFSTGSEQYIWLEEQLAKARDSSLFTFVIVHHAPWSSGPHGLPPGLGGDTADNQSGLPVRELAPLFMYYGVDAVFSGHDEMWERSVLYETQVLEDGSMQPHTVHYYDVGVAGDGLRGPVDGAVNPFRVFLAHNDAPEVWEDSVLVSGGKHYGHLEVEIAPLGDSAWEAVLKPVYVLPVKENGDSLYSGYKVLEYPDRVSLVSRRETGPSAGTGDLRGGIPSGEGFSWRAWPNPFHDQVRITCQLKEKASVDLSLFDLQGRSLRTWAVRNCSAGTYRHSWDGKDEGGEPVPPGLYYMHADIRSAHGSNTYSASLKLVRY
jgi:hypothetical protein